MHSPRAAQIKRIHALQNQRVTEGQILFELNNPELVIALRASRARANLIQARLDRRSADTEDLAQTLVLRDELKRELQNQHGLDQQINDLTVRAPVTGTIAEMAVDLHEGRWINSNLQLGLIVSEQRMSACGYIHADALARIEFGAIGSIRHPEPGLPAPAVRVTHIGAAAVATIDRKPLASVHGGTIASTRRGDQVIPDHSLIEVTVLPSQPQPAPLVETVANLQLDAQGRSAASLVWQQLVRVIVRESII